MKEGWLYTIINPNNGIKDYTCNPEYAQTKSIQGYMVYGKKFVLHGVF